MKRVAKVDVVSAMVYGAVLFAIWTFITGTVLWLLGWIFGASSDWVDLNLVSWTEYTVSTYLSVVWKSLAHAVSGAIAGLVAAVIYNLVAGIMGGLKVELVEDQK